MEFNLVTDIYGSDRIIIVKTLLCLSLYIYIYIWGPYHYSTYLPCFFFQKPDNGKYVSSVMFDGANGVGAAKIEVGLLHLGHSLQVQRYNNGTGRLNHKVSNKDMLINTVLLHQKNSGRAGM